MVDPAEFQNPVQHSREGVRAENENRWEDYSPIGVYPKVKELIRRSIYNPFNIARSVGAVTKCICLVFLTLGIPAKAQLFSDGYFHLDVPYFDGQHLIVLPLASGNTNPSIHCIAADTGNTLWTTSSPNLARNAFKDRVGDLFLIIGDRLEKRKIADGTPIWSRGLIEIPEQKVPATKNGLKWFHQTPNSYSYHIPIIRDSDILIFRQASSVTGCVIERAFADWFRIDPMSGTFLNGGGGTLLGVARETALVRHPVGLGTVKNGEWSYLPSREGYTGHSIGIRSANTSEHSFQNQCLLPFQTKHRDNVWIYNEKNEFARKLSMKQRIGSQIGWVIMPDHVIRYSQLITSPFDLSTKSPSHWMDVIGTHGERTRSFQLTAANSDHQVSYFGRSGDDVVIFQADSNLILLHLPEMRFSIMRFPKQSNLHLSSDGKTILQTTGSTSILRMSTATMESPFSMAAYNLRSGVKRWETKGSITVHRSR